MTADSEVGEDLVVAWFEKRHRRAVCVGASHVKTRERYGMLRGENDDRVRRSDENRVLRRRALNTSGRGRAERHIIEKGSNGRMGTIRTGHQNEHVWALLT